MSDNQPGMAQWALMWPRLAELCKDLKLSASDITRMLNDEFKPTIPLTRNAVVGKIYRTRLQVQWETRPGHKSTVPLAKKYLPTAAPKATNGFVSILDLSGDSCRWPMDGEGATTRYCGVLEASMPGRPYCSMHRRMAYHR